MFRYTLLLLTLLPVFSAVLAENTWLTLQIPSDRC
jgi:hypothetical protein